MIDYVVKKRPPKVGVKWANGRYVTDELSNVYTANDAGSIAGAPTEEAPAESDKQRRKYRRAL